MAFRDEDNFVEQIFENVRSFIISTTQRLYVLDCMLLEGGVLYGFMGFMINLLHSALIL